MSDKIIDFERDSIWIELIVFILGGAAYGMMEILFRGSTHWSMVLTGGACVLTLFYLREWIMPMNLVKGALIGALIITFYEFIVGVLVNIKFQWNVWDYSDRPGNVLGQICPQFSVVWFLICFAFFGGVKLLSQ